MRKSSVVVYALASLVIVAAICNALFFFCKEKPYEHNGAKNVDTNDVIERKLAEMKSTYQLGLAAINSTYEQRLQSFKNEHENSLEDTNRKYEERIEDINRDYQQRISDAEKNHEQFLANLKECLETKIIKNGLYPASCLEEIYSPNLRVPPYPTSKEPLWRKYKEAKKKYNVLFLHMWFHMTKTMDRDFIQLYDAAKRSPLINVTELWGSGWEGWLPRNETLESSGENCYKNIKRKFPNVKWDAVIIEADRFHPIPELSRGLATFNAVYHHELYCKELGKCKLPWDVPYANIFFMSYANSLPGVIHAVTNGENKYADKLFVHVPHGSDRELFYRPPEDARNTSVLLSGKVGYLYPLRQRLQKMINNGDIPKNLTEVREHPGYHNMGNPENKKWNFTDASATQTINYANNLKNAKILLVTRSVRHYAVRKYTEGALAGCLLIGNIPPERQDEFRQYMVEINEDDTDEKIIQTINWWATHDKERIHRAKIGQNIVLQKYTYDAYVEQMISSFVAFEQGYRGAHFPHQFGTSGILG